MPIYEYLCDGCDTRFEQLQTVNDRAAPSCPSCSTDRVRRLISASSFQLKGTGWYVSDYKNGAARAGGSKGESREA
jgi:putative FmdB family regulatory protein